MKTMDNSFDRIEEQLTEESSGDTSNERRIRCFEEKNIFLGFVIFIDRQLEHRQTTR